MQPTGKVANEDFDLVMNLGMRSIYLSAIVILPYIKKRGQSDVFVQIASTASIRHRPGLTWYIASKAAASCATKIMAVEYAADSIHFNAVSPVVGSTGM
jgi:NAD(P)-dependent dehydrogenase (short-subunit alcohol dehydrogenase family)